MVIKIIGIINNWQYICIYMCIYLWKNLFPCNLQGLRFCNKNVTPDWILIKGLLLLQNKIAKANYENKTILYHNIIWLQLRSINFSVFFIIHICYLPQERRRNVAGGKAEKRGPRHAPSWTLRTRTGPRFLLSISCPRSNTSRDALSLFFTFFLSLSLPLAFFIPGCSDK